MDIKQHQPHFSTCEQITVEDVKKAADLGFALIINNRPDKEAEGQPTSAQIATAAQQAGISYIHIPIQRTLPATDIAEMSQQLTSANGSSLAFCRTGTRSTNLWIMTLQGDEQTQAMAKAKALGYDLGLSTKALES